MLSQESLTNTRKHAGCDTAVVRLGYTPGALSPAVRIVSEALGQHKDRRLILDKKHPQHVISAKIRSLADRSGIT
jgi:hypothetical protein